ncbi:MAG: long-chain fatty acid--CoA ligase [Leptolyngbyaceae cyanobacterium bins.302]|nr:long-chain fatty acid--CoA ligase [Leptolyngbyaceae cyanobacterium bins.302]
MSRASTYTMSEIDRQKLSQAVDYTIETVPEIWAIAAQRFGQATALHAPHLKPVVKLTFVQLYEQIRQCASGLQALGVQPGDRICLFADNSPRWLVADQGMMMAGAVNAVRSSQADKDELHFLLVDSGSIALFVEDLVTFHKLQHSYPQLPLKFIVLLSDETPPTESSIKVLNFPQLMELGASHGFQPVSRTREDLATLIYTSGTTGKPKGAMLSHGNLMHQIHTLGAVVQPIPGDRILSILPTWHAYERSAEYFLLAQGCAQIYTSLRTVKKDLAEYKPQYMVSVPRIWESVYEGVQKQFREQPEKKQKLINFFLKVSDRYIHARRIWNNLELLHLDPSLPERLLAGVQMIVLAPLHALGEKIVYNKVRQAATGGEFRQAISGGGALARHIDDFFEIMGIEVLVGYGLTETSPVTNARRPWRNLRGSSGQPIPGTEIKIVDQETRKPLPVGGRGLVLIRGPQIMQGYYNNPQATQKAIDPEGWFDSGDLGWVTPENDLVLTGRAKDTIVLSNGENIEPQPIEDACLRSPYVDQIMLVGQDQKSLGALIVPNLDALDKWAIAQGYTLDLPQPPNPSPVRLSAHVEAQSPTPNLQPLPLDSKPIQDLIRKELNREVQNRPGYRADDRIGPFRLLLEPFAIENGLLTQTLKIRRNVVMDRYQGMINEMFV